MQCRGQSIIPTKIFKAWLVGLLPESLPFFYPMNYSIVINQVAAVQNFPELDIIDMAILDYVRQFFPAAEKYNDVLGQWFWISHKKIIEDMPLLKIKTKSPIIKRINNLVAVGLLKRHPDVSFLSKSYYQFGDNWELLTKYNPNPKDTPDVSNYEGVVSHNTTPPVSAQDTPPISHGTSNYNTNDHSTIDHKKVNVKFTKPVNEIYDEVIDQFPEESKPKTESAKIRWLKEIDKLIRIDKKETNEIKTVIKWARNNEFWRGNFLSILKLRKKNKEEITYYNYFLNQIKNGKSTNTDQKKLSIYPGKTYSASWD